MPPKEKPSKKNQVKKKDQAIEDRTFGLKNKNKSAKVQGFIQSMIGDFTTALQIYNGLQILVFETGVQKSVKNSNGDPVSL